MASSSDRTFFQSASTAGTHGKSFTSKNAWSPTFEFRPK